MIRKLRSGEYRLYSRKINPKTGKRRNLGTFKSRAAAENTNAPCSISNGTEAEFAVLPAALGRFAAGRRGRASAAFVAGDLDPGTVG